MRSPSDVLRLLVGLALVAARRDPRDGRRPTRSAARRPTSSKRSPRPVAHRAGRRRHRAGHRGSVVIVIAFVLIVQRRWRRLLVLLIGAAVAAGTMLAPRPSCSTCPRRRPRSPTTARPSAGSRRPEFPSAAYVAASAAVVTLASVWLSRQWKRALWAAVGRVDAPPGAVVGDERARRRARGRGRSRRRLARARRVRRAEPGTRDGRARAAVADSWSPTSQSCDSAVLRSETLTYRIADATDARSS